MAKFRKKPVVIEAIQFTGSNREEIEAFIGDAGYIDNGGWRVNIKTLEGEMYASDGDWIIKGIKGEFYPCKPDIFEATYEPVTGGLLAPPSQQTAMANDNRSPTPLKDSR